MEETKNLIGNYASKAAQSTLLRSVYVWMTLALVITGFVSMYVAQSYQLVSFIFGNRLALWGMLIAELAVVFYLSARINSISFTKATVMFIIYSILNGATLASIFLVYTMSSIASTFFVAAGTFGVMALYGYITKSDLTRIGNICLMALIGLIIATLVSLFWHNSMLQMIITYVGVILFVGLTAYDSQKIKRLLTADGIEVTEETNRLVGCIDFISRLHKLIPILASLVGRQKINKT